MKHDNLLIAEFMDWEIKGNDVYVPTEFDYKRDMDCGYWTGSYDWGLEFHSSWLWLMAVVDKIETISDFQVTIYTAWKDVNNKYGSGCRISGKNLTVDIVNIEEIKITAVYKSVVEFIKYYKEK